MVEKGFCQNPYEPVLESQTVLAAGNLHVIAAMLEHRQAWLARGGLSARCYGILQGFHRVSTGLFLMMFSQAPQSRDISCVRISSQVQVYSRMQGYWVVCHIACVIG